MAAGLRKQPRTRFRLHIISQSAVDPCDVVDLYKHSQSYRDPHILSLGSRPAEPFELETHPASSGLMRDMSLVMICRWHLERIQVLPHDRDRSNIAKTAQEAGRVSNTMALLAEGALLESCGVGAVLVEDSEEAGCSLDKIGCTSRDQQQRKDRPPTD